MDRFIVYGDSSIELARNADEDEVTIDEFMKLIETARKTAYVLYVDRKSKTYATEENIIKAMKQTNPPPIEVSSTRSLETEINELVNDGYTLIPA